MVAQVISFQLQAGKLDELIHIAANSIIPLMQQQPGCRLITMLGDSAADRVLAIGLWDSMTDLQNNEQSNRFQEQFARVQQLCARQPARDLYEVCLQSAPI